MCSKSAINSVALKRVLEKVLKIGALQKKCLIKGPKKCHKKGSQQKKFQKKFFEKCYFEKVLISRAKKSARKSGANKISSRKSFF